MAALGADEKGRKFAEVRALLASRGLLAPGWPVQADTTGTRGATAVAAAAAVAEPPPLDDDLLAPVREPDALATGIAALDALLPGGFPRRAVTEVLGSVASGKTTLVAHALARLTQARRLVAWIDPFEEAYPPAFAALGVQLSRLLWVRPCESKRAADRAKDALWSAEVLLQSAAFEAVVLDVSRLSFEAAPDAPARERVAARMALERRAVVLRSATETSGVALIVLGETTGLPTPGAPPALSLRITPLLAATPSREVQVQITRSRWGTLAHTTHLKAGPYVG